MKNRYVLLLDLPLIALAAFAAFTARFDFAFYAHREEFVPYLLFGLATKPWVFGAFGLYRRYWQYTTIPDVALVFAAVAASSLLMGAFVVLGRGQFFFEFSPVVVLNNLMMTMSARARTQPPRRCCSRRDRPAPGTKAQHRQSAGQARIRSTRLHR